MNNQNKKSQFRGVKMDDLLKYADLPIWKVRESSRNKYLYPISKKDKEAISAGDSIAHGIPVEQLRKVGPFLTAVSPQSHIGPYLHAIDFLVPDGTAVLAAQDGKIIEDIDYNSEWGDDPKFRDKLNYVTIEHKNNEFSQYCHLAENSVRFGCSLGYGSKVKAGQVIGKVGKTGWTDRDHLHFIVFRRDKNPFRFRSLQVRFIKLFKF